MKRLISLLIALALCGTALAATDVYIQTKAQKIEYDTAGGGIEYFGWALPGTATSVARWKIMRITTTSSDFVIEWADGNQNYDNEWDERIATVVYE